MAKEAKKGKKVSGMINLLIKPGAANPSPPVGPALGQKGVNIMEFCKSFNDKTKDLDKQLPIKVIITVYEDRSFTFITKTPPAAALIKKTLGLKSGSATPHTNKVGKLTRSQLEDIAKIKLPDLNTDEIEEAKKIVAGSARSMGLDVVD